MNLIRMYPESFATYGQWLWLDERGYGDVATTAQGALARRQNGTSASGTPALPRPS